MSVEALAAWVLSVMLSALPPGKSRTPREARETPEAGRDRYEEIARVIAEVTADPYETPLFDGPRGREKTAALLLAISYYESHWRRDVDLGIGPNARGGGGRYHCMMQISVERSPITPEGWSAQDLVKSREKCFRRALHILQRGKRMCRGRGMLNHYATGRCDYGRKAVGKRWRVYESWLSRHPFPDSEKRPDTEKR